MKTVIFCNSFRKPDKLLNREPNKKTHYLIINYNSRLGKFIEFVQNNPERFISVDNIQFPKKLVNDFQSKFVNLVGNLNKENHSLFWWCLNFTNKNPMTTQLCNRIFHTLNIIDIIENSDTTTLLVVTEDTELLKQLQIYAKGRQVKIINAITFRLDIKDITKHLSSLAVFFAFFRSLLYSLYAKFYSPFKFNIPKKYTIVFSLLSQQSFTKEGIYRDSYFGEFVYYLKKNNVPFLNILMVISPGYRRLLKKAYAQKSFVPILTIEHFLSIVDLISCLYHSLIKYFTPIRIKGEMDIDGINLSHLVRRAIRNEYISTYFFDNLRIYYAIKSLSEKTSIDRFYYPFENRSFEKNIINSLRKYSPDTKIIGYQHASLSLRHTNFLLEKDEHVITPLPDRIKTMGETTRDIMDKIGNFPKDLLQIGCGLRQSVFKGELKKKKTRISNILVALSTNLEEYVKVLNFLNKALSGVNSYQVWIRPHPVFSLEEAIKVIGRLNFKFYKADKESLEECYNWADVVLYVHSTLSIESLTRGIPVVNIIVPDALNPDPLFNFDDFKWGIKCPQDLIPTIKMIDSMDEREFISRQEKASAYASRYIHNVNEEKLEEFLRC